MVLVKACFVLLSCLVLGLFNVFDVKRIITKQTLETDQLIQLLQRIITYIILMIFLQNDD